MIKKVYVCFLLWCCIMNGMQNWNGIKNGNRGDDSINVRMGGHALQRIGGDPDYVCLYDVVKNSNDATGKIWCSGIFDNHKERELCESMRNNFFPLFQQAYAEKKSIKESLLYACASCRKLMSVSCVSPVKGFNLLVSCVECEAKKLHLLWLGDVRGIVQGEGDAVYTKTYKPVEVTSNYVLIKEIDKKIGLRDRCRKVEWIESPNYACISLKNNDEYFLGASGEFWDIFKETEVVKILSDASELNEEEFNKKYAPYVHDDIDESPYSQDDFEDGVTSNIARKMAFIAACNRKILGNPAVMITSFDSQQSEEKSENRRDAYVCDETDYGTNAESSSSFSDGDLTQPGEIQVVENETSVDEAVMQQVDRGAQAAEQGDGWLATTYKRLSVSNMTDIIHNFLGEGMISHYRS